MSVPDVTIIGGGLAGSEAAWQAARHGLRVRLLEMRPQTTTPAHRTDRLAELVCSNSFRGEGLHNAVGLLKEELRRADSLILAAADRWRVPAGGALAVDREGFAADVTDRLTRLGAVEIVRREGRADDATALCIIATGPLTSESMAGFLMDRTGSGQLYFYDAIAPIVDAETIDGHRVFRASRYGRGGDDYLNCPMTKAQYDRFYEALLSAETAPVRAFEKEKVFEGCMPIEVMAARGRETPLFGPMKPVGLSDPATGREPYAVVQLRMENRHGTAYNLVGFQTRLKWPEQERVLRLIPGLENATFLRYGSLHRNTFLCSPRFLSPTLQFRDDPSLILAGQISGVEGYVESTAMGLLAGLNAARLHGGRPAVAPPDATAHGALVGHITRSDPARFQPSNVNFGLFPPLAQRIRRKRDRYEALSARALEQWTGFLDRLERDEDAPVAGAV